MNLDQAAKRIKGELPTTSFPQLDPMLIALLIQVIVKVIQFCREQNSKAVAKRMKAIVGPWWWLRPVNHKVRSQLRAMIDVKFRFRDCEDSDIDQLFEACLEALHGATPSECLAVVQDARSQ